MAVSETADFKGTLSPATDIVPKVTVAGDLRNLQPETPKLPASASLGQSSTHLLTLRSNYDCITQGQASQLGLHYPVDLRATANSTRNSNKRAEKNRRDRLALAMQELNTLLPKTSTLNSIGSQRYCKAETVESAIQYIKELQEEINASKRQR
ncbi:hypothetical protein LTR67_008405 [Exophiala xenobiotica]